jgi:hypothetical protein
MKEELIVLSDYLDKKGYIKEANKVDGLLIKVAADYSEEAESAGLSDAALRAITELLLRISRDPECIERINQYSEEDAFLSEEEAIALIDADCFAADEDGISGQYADRAQGTVGKLTWLAENPVKAALIGLASVVIVGWAIPALIKWIRNKLVKSRAKKIKRTQQGMYATTQRQDGGQAFTPQSGPAPRDLTQKELLALQSKKSDKYLAAIDKGYVDIIITHNHASASSEKKEVYFEGVKIGLKAESCPEIITTVNADDLSSLFTGDSIINFGETKKVSLNFDNNFYQNQNVLSALKTCPSFKGFGQELVTPRLIRAVFFMKGFGRFEVPLKFIDGQQIYKVSTIGF